MLTIKYQLGGDEAKMPAEKRHSKIAFERAAHVKSLFDLLAIVSVEQHFSNCEVANANEELNLTLNNIGILGALLADGLFNEIDRLENIAEQITTFVLPENAETK